MSKVQPVGYLYTDVRDRVNIAAKYVSIEKQSRNSIGRNYSARYVCANFSSREYDRIEHGNHNMYTHLAIYQRVPS